MSQAIRVFLADDHAVVRRGLQALIGTEPDMVVVGSAANGVEAVEGVARTGPDVIVLDLEMPQMGGLEAIDAIRGADPEARILIVTSFGDDERVFSAVKRGALGYLLKDSSPAELLQAIRDVHEGRASLHPELALKVIRELKTAPPGAAAVAPDGFAGGGDAGAKKQAEPLTTREVEVLQLIARGWTNRQIADHLIVSERTVRTHISNILGKLHLANRTQAALYALREGLARLDDSAE